MAAPGLRDGLEFCGEVEEYMRHVGWDRYRGWIAIYAKETGKISVYESGSGKSPKISQSNLQTYFVLYRRWAKNRVMWIDGYDEYALIGYDKRVKGKMLSDERFADVMKVAQGEFNKWVASGN